MAKEVLISKKWTDVTEEWLEAAYTWGGAWFAARPGVGTSATATSKVRAVRAKVTPKYLHRRTYMFDHRYLDKIHQHGQYQAGATVIINGLKYLDSTTVDPFVKKIVEVKGIKIK